MARWVNRSEIVESRSMTRIGIWRSSGQQRDEQDNDIHGLGLHAPAPPPRTRQGSPPQPGWSSLHEPWGPLEPARGCSTLTIR